MSETVIDRLTVVKARIARAVEAAGRSEHSVTLVAVSKTHPATAVRTVAQAGQRVFGESYVQEALDKMDTLADLPLEWHFIGPIQSNKTRDIAARFAWVHSVDRLKIAQRLSDQRPAELPPLQLCLQVNVSGEASKSGVSLEELPGLARAVMELPGLTLRGLMAIPAPAADEAARRRPFRQLREARDRLNAELGLALDTLSMGMSGDLEAAVAEGATLVRVGSDIFGPRDYG